MGRSGHRLQQPPQYRKPAHTATTTDRKPHHIRLLLKFTPDQREASRALSARHELIVVRWDQAKQANPPVRSASIAGSRKFGSANMAKFTPTTNSNAE